VTTYKAPPEAWEFADYWKGTGPCAAAYTADCILELRARVEALEALIHELQTMHNTAVDWKMEQDYRLNELEAATTPPRFRPGVHVVVATPTAGGGPPVKAVEVPSNCRQRLEREGKAYPKSSCDACGTMSPAWRQCNAALEAEAAQPQPAPAGSLVEQIADALCRAQLDSPSWEPEARAAIREMAAWLRSQGLSTGDYWAERLEREAER